MRAATRWCSTAPARDGGRAGGRDRAGCGAWPRRAARHRFSTAQAIVEALKSLGMRRVVLFSPYPQATNDHEKEFLRRARHRGSARTWRSMCGSSDEYIRVPVSRLDRARPRARARCRRRLLPELHQHHPDRGDRDDRARDRKARDQLQPGDAVGRAQADGGARRMPRIPGLGRLFAQAEPVSA